jgi:hypothetical protein
MQMPASTPPVGPPTASDAVRERNAPRRERVLRSIKRLREIADAKRRPR